MPMPRPAISELLHNTIASSLRAHRVEEVAVSRDRTGCQFQVCPLREVAAAGERDLRHEVLLLRRGRTCSDSGTFVADDAGGCRPARRLRAPSCGALVRPQRVRRVRRRRCDRARNGPASHCPTRRCRRDLAVLHFDFGFPSAGPGARWCRSPSRSGCAPSRRRSAMPGSSTPPVRRHFRLRRQQRQADLPSCMPAGIRSSASRAGIELVEQRDVEVLPGHARVTRQRRNGSASLRRRTCPSPRRPCRAHVGHAGHVVRGDVEPQLRLRRLAPAGWRRRGRCAARTWRRPEALRHGNRGGRVAWRGLEWAAGSVPNGNCLSARPVRVRRMPRCAAARAPMKRPACGQARFSSGGSSALTPSRSTFPSVPSAASRGSGCSARPAGNRRRPGCAAAAGCWS